MRQHSAAAPSFRDGWVTCPLASSVSQASFEASQNWLGNLPPRQRRKPGKFLWRSKTNAEQFFERSRRKPRREEVERAGGVEEGMEGMEGRGVKKDSFAMLPHFIRRINCQGGTGEGRDRQAWGEWS